MQRGRVCRTFDALYEWARALPGEAVGTRRSRKSNPDVPRVVLVTVGMP